MVLSQPGPSPAARITVLLRMASEGFADAFGAKPEWLEAPAAEFDELRDLVGEDRIAQLHGLTGLRRGSAYRAGGAPGTVTLAPQALAGVLGLLGMAALPPDVLVEETAAGPSYQVPEDWFGVEPSAPQAG